MESIDFHMASLTLIPGGQKRDFPDSTRLLDALLDMGVVVKTPCGGKGICGKCRISGEGAFSAKTDAEKKATIKDTRGRLACQTHLAGNVNVFIDEKRIPAPKAYPVVNPDESYAIAVDIGTTSVSVALVSLTQEKQFDLDSFLNPQRRFGHDVISRIAAASNPEFRKAMTLQIRQAIFSTIVNTLSAMKVPFSRIEKIVFSGNTTMLYLLFGMDVSGLGRYPFKLSRLDFGDISAADIDASMFSHVRTTALPAVSAFLGGDFLGGLALSHEKGFHEKTFFIDLGTNGEMFLINRSGAIYAASCAMGPALEGVNMSCGMTADEGAVTHVQIDSGKLVYDMIDEGAPVGLTGTALIDLVAIFLSEGIIQKNGAFSAYLDHKTLLHPASYKNISESKQINLWEDITISQNDIRNLQLAKAASKAAAQLLLQVAGCRADEVAHVLIAGALGSHLNMANFRRLGFLPDFSFATYHYLANTSLQAAFTACLDGHFLQKAAQLRNRVREVKLAENPSFNREFISALSF